ncbi:MAG: hypothetical protein AAGF66_12040, partial [Cyanobacteria bacterium P01_H01_bin.119]
MAQSRGDRSAIVCLFHHQRYAQGVVGIVGLDDNWRRQGGPIALLENLSRRYRQPGDRPTLAPPVIVKPNDADNSLGVSLVMEEADYSAAIAAALRHSREVLVEQYIPLGREVRCGLVEQGDRLIELP